MFTWVVLISTTLLSIKGCADLTYSSNYDLEARPLTMSLGNQLINWSDTRTDRNGRTLRHLSRPRHDSIASHKLLADRIRDYLSWQNRRKLERHALRITNVRYPTLKNRSKSKHLDRITVPGYNHHVSDSERSQEYLHYNSLQRTNSRKSGDMITGTTVPRITYTDLYKDRFQELTTNHIHDVPMFTEQPNIVEYSTHYAFKTYKDVTESLLGLYKLREKTRRKHLLESYLTALEDFERKFYSKSFQILREISPADRQVNGISFVQSGLFMSLLLLSLSTATDSATTKEINSCIGLDLTETDKITLIEEILTILPNSTNGLRWRWSSRLVLGVSQDISQQFRQGAASAMHLIINKFNGTETSEVMTTTLNNMVKQDSGGAIRDAFEEEEMSKGVRAVALATLYLRATWRSAPTVLNGTMPFRDANGSPPSNARMIRINDVMGYADLKDWDFYAIEIPYSTPGLSLLILVPYDTSLRNITQLLNTTSLDQITGRLATIRVAVTMPIYTLRMTLLLPSKLQAMGVNSLFNWTSTGNGKLRLSHAVQRLMFWAEAGRNAFKDDGLEWDEVPQIELVVDRPYIFFVRWKNLTIMNGNFVL